ncbi:cytochrome P450 [Mycena sp. CBHHK59/15]|nr:cytochrome P450 [Mycena sp. CBHHK59/15]
MPSRNEGKVFSSWAKSYGEITYLNIFGQPIVILSALGPATDLLEKRSSIYSDRPHLVMAGDLVGFDQGMPFAPYDERFRGMRKILRPELTKSGLEPYWNLHEQESRTLVRKTLRSPEELLSLIRHYSGSIILKVTYGYQTQPTADPWLELAEQVMNVFSKAATPGTWLCDLIPLLKHIPRWFPGSGFRHEADGWRELHERVVSEPYEWSKRNQNEAAIVKPNLLSTIFAQNTNGTGASPMDEALLMRAAGSLFGGGSDTTVAAISTFFLAMALFPNVQAKAQDELDRVVGRGRLPHVADRASLPYVDAIMTECLRWRPVAPMGLPHRLIKDDEYKGYHIPKNSLIMVNSRHIMHDPGTFADPETFRPERFLNDPQARDIVHRCSFGFGRRACPGQLFAEGSMFVAIASVLSACKLSNPIDEHGQPVEQDVEHKPGTISHPKAFTCTILSRHEAVEDLLQDNSSKI